MLPVEPNCFHISVFFLQELRTIVETVGKQPSLICEGWPEIKHCLKYRNVTLCAHAAAAVPFGQIFVPQKVEYCKLGGCCSDAAPHPHPKPLPRYHTGSQAHRSSSALVKGRKGTRRQDVHTTISDQT